MPLQETQPLSRDDTLIRDGIERARAQGTVINDLTARIIASQCYDGQGTLLYQLTSTGAISHVGFMLAAIDVVRKGHCTPEESRMLDALSAYVVHRGKRGPQDGWSNLRW